ncbi:hypothetical protein AAZX31_12G141200 [Glycine max]
MLQPLLWFLALLCFNVHFPKNQKHFNLHSPISLEDLVRT